MLCLRSGVIMRNIRNIHERLNLALSKTLKDGIKVHAEDININTKKRRLSVSIN